MNNSRNPYKINPKSGQNIQPPVNNRPNIPVNQQSNIKAPNSPIRCNPQQRPGVHGANPAFNPNDFRLEENATERKTWGFTNIVLAFVFLVIFSIGGYVAMSLLWVKTPVDVVTLWAVLCIVYAIILYFLLEPKVIKEINKKETRTISKEIVKEIPTVKEVVKEVPITKEIVKEVYKPVPVVQEVVKEVVREVKVPVVKEVKVPVVVPRPKLDIPKYDFVASMLTKTYHKSNCRLSKSIKRKYKEYSNDEWDFKRKKYSPCKVCVTKEAKA